MIVSCFSACHLKIVCAGGTKVNALIYGMRVPEAQKGSVYEGLMHVTDWFPTVLDIAEIAYLPDSNSNKLDGVSHKDAMIYGYPETPRYTMLYNAYANIQGWADSKEFVAPQAVRNERFKLIRAYVGNPTGARYDGPQLNGGDNDDTEKQGFDKKDDQDDELEKNTFACDQPTAMMSGEFNQFL